MIVKLTDTQIEELLSRQLVGRIGCIIHNTVYVVPISYVYKDNCIYAHTYEGLKLEAMRSNPAVCFEVDDYSDMANWQSVIAWGKFKEITDNTERAVAIQLLAQRRLPVPSSVTTRISASWPFYEENSGQVNGVTFKIVLDTKTGRGESYHDAPRLNG